MVWQMAGIVITSLVIAFIFSIDSKHPEFEGPDDDTPATGEAA